jgi:hypothetical protein
VRTARVAAALIIFAAIGAGCGDNTSNWSSGQPAADASASGEPSATAAAKPKPKEKPKQESSGQTKKDLVKAMLAEPDFDGIPADAKKNLADCMANVIIKYGDKKGIEKYIDGDIKLDDIKGANSKKAEEEGFACAEKAYNG